MKINIKKVNSIEIKDDEVEIIIKHSNNNRKIEQFIKYINEYNIRNEEFVLVNYNNTVIKVKYDDIIIFYSDKKNNFCKTLKNTYKIKSKLYEIENINSNFVRISKSCIININFVKKFDMSETGKIIVIMIDDTSEIVSRRKIKTIMQYLGERSI